MFLFCQFRSIQQMHKYMRLLVVGYSRDLFGILKKKKKKSFPLYWLNDWASSSSITAGKCFAGLK